MVSKQEHIFLASPHMSEQKFEQGFIEEAFESNWIGPLGKNVNEFEKEMSARLGTKDAAALSSGTASLHLALKAVGVEKGDVVLVSDLTFAASANPVLYCGAIPIFVDSCFDTWNMSPAALEKAFQKLLASGAAPKAVILVHIYGLSADIDKIMEICRRYHTPLIEDAAESLGTTYKGRYTGTFGDYGIISFNGNKIITGSGGGMLLCNTYDAVEKAKKVRFWATQSREPQRWYEHTEIGYNYRMSNIMAGIGRGQLRVLDERIKKKRYLYDYYLAHIGKLPGISFMPLYDWERSNCWLTVIQLADEVRVKPVDIMLALEKNNIETRPVWKPMHLQPLFAEYEFLSEEDKNFTITDPETGADDSVSGVLFSRGVCLPSDTKMTDEDLNRVCIIIRSLWGQG